METAVEFPKEPVAPKSTAQRFLRHHFAGRLKQGEQQLKGQVFDFYALFIAQQEGFSGPYVKSAETIAIACGLG